MGVATHNLSGNGQIIRECLSIVRSAAVHYSGYCIGAAKSGRHRKLSTLLNFSILNIKLLSICRTHLTTLQHYGHNGINVLHITSIRRLILG